MVRHSLTQRSYRTGASRARLAVQPVCCERNQAVANAHTRSHTDSWCSVNSRNKTDDADASRRQPEYLKLEQVAARLKLKDKGPDWILRGELPAYKLGKEWRIRRDDFDRAMRARRTRRAGAFGRSLGSRQPWIASNGSLQPLKSYVSSEARH